jgi:predicted Zn finger-like uncharacterized protein
MIIDCINCNKKFNVNDELIPQNGRQIICGSCNHSWHYTLETSLNKSPVFKNENTIHSKQSKNIKPILENQAEKEDEKIIENYETKLDIRALNNPDTSNKSGRSKTSIFFSYLLVFIISFVALLIFVDTIKSPLINIFPGIEIILFNLFETLKDVKLFIIDLT